MKTLKLLSASLLALAAAGLASAQTITLATAPANVLDMVGSTAFRSAVVTAEVTELSNVGANLPGGVAYAAFIGSAGNGNLQGATVSIVYGYDSNGNEVMFRNHWTGSVAGCYDLSNVTTTLSELPPVGTAMLVTTTVGGIAGGGGGNALASGSDTAFDTNGPTVAMTDAQAADGAASIATAIGGGTFANKITGASLVNAGGTSNGVAAVTFEWVLGKSPNAFTTSGVVTNTTNWTSLNLTQQQALTIVKNGFISLTDVTANSADSTTYVAGIGRNEDSGSRVMYIAESFGQGNLTPAFGVGINQFMCEQDSLIYPLSPSGTGYPTMASGTTITGFKPWPKFTQTNSGGAGGTYTNTTTGWFVNTITGLTWKLQGHSGYNGGGDVAAILETNDPVTISGNFANGAAGLPAGATGVYFVSCLGTSDAAKAVAKNAVGLSYNGVPFSIGAVTEGQYSLYNFEHMYYLPSLVDAGGGVNPKTVADGLAAALTGLTQTQLGAAGVPISAMLNGLARGQTAGSQIP